ncbi:hypothetical protein [Kitasatospora xanthocidica]|uniref:hypothetical protein n=1 Tax=Kitasatospora xanthocidica TaxID=83382 RepID=UPI001671999C|nr:hypothetical protein [Kitasatospora xanthocidica]GHF56304.1 hypothetical protein GCM10018790_37870 [Kitasatospora xanthocidica]
MEHSKPSLPRAHRWRRDTVELAAVFLSVTAADLIAKLVVEGPDGPVVLVSSALALIATALFHTWWSPHAPPPTTLWRVRTTPLSHTPAALADHRITLLSLHPEELFLRTPRSVTPADLAAVLATTGHTVEAPPTRIA